MDKNATVTQAQEQLVVEEANMQLQHRRLRYWRMRSRHWWSSSIRKDAAREASGICALAEERVSAAKLALQRARHNS